MLSPSRERPARVSQSYEHYYEDVFVIVQVGDVLYHLPAAVLARRSQVFATLFSLPQTSGSVWCTEGLSDNEPIILQGHRSADFDCLMQYLFGGPVFMEKIPAIRCLISLLKMCDFFEIVDGRTYAISSMEHHPDLDLASRLLLCHQYSIVTWLGFAFRGLAALPLHHHTEAELGTIPMKFIHSLIAVRHWVMTHCLTLAAVPPSIVNGFNCVTPATCGYAWESAWKHGPSEMFRHPDVDYNGCAVLEALEAASIPSICQGCLELSIANVKDSGSLIAEEQFVEDTVRKLTQWMGSC
ncbi:hypothetical protein PAXINDRAFT_11903 [Paxillus involutus ATCC 200175]|uniref:BTB domain-containing protein n=1 Tax=Paxillus involutus ATCC 200175 TaxID=664439 RepID=A0A0C9U7F3_PAXIN|nr:hypothetical protein PAXINDRAFT_11903 [Paxillus involutus ATCC 200175]